MRSGSFRHPVKSRIYAILSKWDGTSHEFYARAQYVSHVRTILILWDLARNTAMLGVGAAAGVVSGASVVGGAAGAVPAVVLMHWLSSPAKAASVAAWAKAYRGVASGISTSAIWPLSRLPPAIWPTRLVFLSREFLGILAERAPCQPQPTSNSSNDHRHRHRENDRNGIGQKPRPPFLLYHRSG